MNEFAQLREAAEAATPGPWWTDAEYDGKEMGCAIIAARTDAGPLPGNPTRGMVAFATAILNTEARRCEATARFIALANPATILALLARLEAAERDAGRYRWLRNHGDQFDDLPILDGRGRLVAEFLDTAIDAALATQEQP